MMTVVPKAKCRCPQYGRAGAWPQRGMVRGTVILGGRNFSSGVVVMSWVLRAQGPPLTSDSNLDN